jgi:hypothetical protein
VSTVHLLFSLVKSLVPGHCCTAALATALVTATLSWGVGQWQPGRCSAQDQWEPGRCSLPMAAWEVQRPRPMGTTWEVQPPNGSLGGAAPKTNGNLGGAASQWQPGRRGAQAQQFQLRMRDFQSTLVSFWVETAELTGITGILL